MMTHEHACDLLANFDFSCQQFRNAMRRNEIIEKKTGKQFFRPFFFSFLGPESKFCRMEDEQMDFLLTASAAFSPFAGNGGCLLCLLACSKKK
jgi:hypothetical protein